MKLTKITQANFSVKKKKGEKPTIVFIYKARVVNFQKFISIEKTFILLSYLENALQN